MLVIDVALIIDSFHGWISHHHHIHFFHVFLLFLLFILLFWLFVKAIAAVDDEADDQTNKNKAKECNVDPANFNVIVNHFHLSLQTMSSRKHKWVLEFLEALIRNVALVSLGKHWIGNDTSVMSFHLGGLIASLIQGWLFNRGEVDGPCGLK